MCKWLHIYGQLRGGDEDESWCSSSAALVVHVGFLRDARVYPDEGPAGRQCATAVPWTPPARTVLRPCFSESLRLSSCSWPLDVQRCADTRRRQLISRQHGCQGACVRMSAADEQAARARVSRVVETAMRVLCRRMESMCSPWCWRGARRTRKLIEALVEVLRFPHSEDSGSAADADPNGLP